MPGSAAPTRLATITPGGKPNTTIVSSAGLSPTGGTLATILEDSVQLLGADPGALANRLCSFTGRAITPLHWQRYASSVPYQQPCP